MVESAQVILSGFADEAAREKTLDQQFSAFAAIGLEHFAIRFIDPGHGVKNVMQLSDAEVARIRDRMSDYGLRVSSIGSPIGKIKLLDVADETNHRYIDPQTYLNQDVRRACELAHAFETQLIRGFSFYPPRNSDANQYLEQATERLSKMVEMCDAHGLTFGLEVEANLIGHTGWLLAEIHRRVNHPALLLVFDGANLRVQGFSTDQIFEQYLAMKPGLGWLHVKDYRQPAAQKTGDSIPDRGAMPTAYLNEEALNQFVPVGLGESAYERVFADLRGFIPELERRLALRRIEGVCLELEPHLKQGGQFGGFSGADGFGIALRYLCQLLDASGIGYHLRDWPDLTAADGRR